MNPNLTPYDGVQGFGMVPQADIAELMKALEAGVATSPDTQAGGGALRLESLEASLKVLTWQDKQVVFWRDIPKTKAYSTVEEYTRLSSYGVEGGNVFAAEGQLPNEQDSTYDRQARFVKFLGTTRSVTHPMTLVRAMGGDVMTRENTNGILWMLRHLEHALFFGDSKLNVGGTEWIEFDGLDKQIDSANVIDLAGQPIDERTLRDASQTVLDNYGVPTHLYGSPQVLEDYAKSYIPAYRVPVQNGDGTFGAGFVVNKVNTVAGQIDLRGDVFLRRFGVAPSTATSNSAPSTPATAVAVVSGGADSGEWSKSTSTTLAVTYRVTAVNDKGESAYVTSGLTTLTAGDLTKSIALTITNPTPQATAPVYFKVYRKDGSGTYSMIKRIAATSAAAGGTTVFTDRNVSMPNTFTAFLGEMTPDVIEFRQLVDLVKMDLAMINPAYRWMLLLYGVPILYAPKKWTKLINIGLAT